MKKKHKLGKTGVVCELATLGVLPEFGGKGIGGELTRLCVKRAVDKGYLISKAECSSAFSTKAIVKQGGKIEKTIVYKDFVCKGKNPFTAAQEPHTCMNLVVFRHKDEEMYKLD